MVTVLFGLFLAQLMHHASLSDHALHCCCSRLVVIVALVGTVNQLIDIGPCFNFLIEPVGGIIYCQNIA